MCATGLQMSPFVDDFLLSFVYMQYIPFTIIIHRTSSLLDTSTHTHARTHHISHFYIHTQHIRTHTCTHIIHPRTHTPAYAHTDTILTHNSVFTCVCTVYLCFCSSLYNSLYFNRCSNTPSTTKTLQDTGHLS